MDNIKILINKEKLQRRVKELAHKIEDDYKDKEINIIYILKGSVFSPVI